VGRPVSHRGHRGTSRGRTPRPAAAEPDTGAAVELVIATLDHRPFLPMLRGLDRNAVIAGLIHLTTILGEQIVGPGRPDVFRAALRDLQVHQRLEAVFPSEVDDQQ